MDWLIRLVDQFEHMPTDKAALLILFVALLIIAGALFVMSRRDKTTAAVDQGQMTAVMNLTSLANSLSEGLKPIAESFKQLTEQFMEQLRAESTLRVQQFTTVQQSMMEVGKQRGDQLQAIQTGIAALPGTVEEGMKPQLDDLEARLNNRLDLLETQLKQLIANLPSEVATAVTSILSHARQEIISEAIAASTPPVTSEIKPIGIVVTENNDGTH